MFVLLTQLNIQYNIIIRNSCETALNMIQPIAEPRSLESDYCVYMQLTQEHSSMKS